MKLIRVFSTFFYLFIFSLPLQAESGGEGNSSTAKNSVKDTVPAIVMYGSRSLFENIDYMSETGVIHYRDSLLLTKEPPKILLHQINTYLRIKTMKDDEVIHLIDSLFELDAIPYPLINQINLYVAGKRRERMKNYKLNTEMPSTVFFIPASNIYPFWNTKIPHPYNDKLFDEDESKQLVLRDSRKGDTYVHPIRSKLNVHKECVVTSNYGWRDGRNHNGTDIDLEVWDTVKSCFSGMVRFATSYSNYGRLVIVRHHNGLETYYAHLHRIKVKTGQMLKAGDIVGLGGKSGNASGSHLHFECRYKGVPLDAEQFISFKERKLLCDTISLIKSTTGFAAFPKGTEIHVVQRGDYLHKIAIKYGITVAKLCELNRMHRKQRLKVGQKLKVSIV